MDNSVSIEQHSRMGVDVHQVHAHIIYSATEKKGQLYSSPPQPLFTASAVHISSLIHFYVTRRMIIMITIITTHIKSLTMSYSPLHILLSAFLTGDQNKAPDSLSQHPIVIHRYMLERFIHDSFPSWEFSGYKDSIGNREVP